MNTRSCCWTRSRSFILLFVALTLTLGPVGCSKMPRNHWWQFWRPKAAQSELGSGTVLPPPPGSLDSGLGISSVLPPPPVSADTLEPNRPKAGNAAQVAELRSVFFDYDSDQLTPTAQATLDQNLQWLQSNANTEIQIGGHCDARGSTEYNLALGERRAKSVMAYLVNKGIQAQRLHTISYGEENPAVPGDGEDAYSKNRRAEFLVYY